MSRGNHGRAKHRSKAGWEYRHIKSVRDSKKRCGKNTFCPPWTDEMPNFDAERYFKELEERISSDNQVVILDAGAVSLRVGEENFFNYFQRHLVYGEVPEYRDKFGALLEQARATSSGLDRVTSMDDVFLPYAVSNFLLKVVQVSNNKIKGWTGHKHRMRDLIIPFQQLAEITRGASAKLTRTGWPQDTLFRQTRDRLVSDAGVLGAREFEYTELALALFSSYRARIPSVVFTRQDGLGKILGSFVENRQYILTLPQTFNDSSVEIIRISQNDTGIDFETTGEYLSPTYSVA